MRPSPTSAVPTTAGPTPAGPVLAAVLLAVLLVGTLLGAGTASAAPPGGGSSPAEGPVPFTGTVSEIVDPDAETGLPRRWLRHVGDPAPDGFIHGYQWAAPRVGTTPGAGTVTLAGTLDVTAAAGGDFGLLGLLDSATLAAGERGLNEGVYVYLAMRDEDTLRIGLSDGRVEGGEYVQEFHDVDLTTTDRRLEVRLDVDAGADPAGCASDAADVATAEGCLRLAVDDLPVLVDSYGSITHAAANGGVELRDGGTPGWDGLASATAATGFRFDLTVTPAVARPSSKEDCTDGGWEELGFRNQGQCIRSVVTP